MEKLKIYNSFKFSKFIKFFFIITISLFLFLSFRNSIYFSNNKIIYLITFLFFQSLIITNIFYKKEIFYNLNIIIFLNLLITPFFFNLTFDVPYRHPNTKKELIWAKDLNNGFEFKKHIISTDSQGNRVNKKIDYSSKKESTFRVFAIGASTTEEEGLDDSLIWTNRLIKKLRKDNSFNKKDYEIINFGIGGLRSIHHYFTVKKNLKLKPDLLIFLIGVNDWNYQIINKEENFLYSEFEIAFDFRSSLFHKVANQIYKQIKKKIVIINPAGEKKIETKENNSFKNTNPYLNLIKKNLYQKKYTIFFKVNLRNVSVRYDYWLKK